MAKFLSEDWVAQARALQEEYKGEGAPPPAKARINLTITDVPADVSDSPIAAKIDTTQGSIDLDFGTFDSPDASVTLEYRTAQALLVEQNPQAVMQAVFGGKVKLEGDIAKVLAFQSATPDDTAVEIARRIRDLTD